MRQKDNDSLNASNDSTKKNNQGSRSKNKIAASEKTQVEAVNALASHINKADCET